MQFVDFSRYKLLEILEQIEKLFHSQMDWIDAMNLCLWIFHRMDIWVQTGRWRKGYMAISKIQVDSRRMA